MILTWTQLLSPLSPLKKSISCENAYDFSHTIKKYLSSAKLKQIHSEKKILFGFRIFKYDQLIKIYQQKADLDYDIQWGDLFLLRVHILDTSNTPIGGPTLSNHTHL